MEDKEDSVKTEKNEANIIKHVQTENDKSDKEEKKKENIRQTSAKEEKEAEIGGVAGLLGKTASILGALVQKEEEAPKTSLPAEDVETYKEAFNDFDHNKDGHISTQVSNYACGFNVNSF